MSIGFRDRVYQRSLNDVAVYPAICKSFIYDNAACQKGKGTSFAISRLKLFLHKMYRRYGTEFYVLQCDIHGYYPNMSHKVAKDRFCRSLDRWTYDRCVEVLDGQYATDTGYNPGSQMVQIAGISVLDNMDHLIKEQLRVKYYVRYMDDFVLFSNDKTYLENCRKEIVRSLGNIKFELHPKKTRLYKINKGIDFLGFKFKLTDTGKIVLLIDPLNVKKRRMKLYRMVAMVKSGNMSKHKVYECSESWKAHARKGNSFKIIERMDKYLKRLWEDDNHGNTEKSSYDTGKKNDGA